VVLLRRRGEVARSFCARWVVVQGGLALLILPWAAFAATSIQLGRLRWIEQYHPLVQFVGGLVRFSTGYPGIAQDALEQRTIAGVLALCSAFLVTGVAAAGLVRDENGQPRSLRTALRERQVVLCLWYLTAPIAMMLAISLFHRLLAPRHMLMTAPAFLLLVALGLSRLLPGRMIAATALIVSLLVAGLIARLSTPRTRDYRGAAALIAGEAAPGDVLLVYGEHPRLILRYYLRSRESEFRWCPRSLREASLQTTQGCLNEARRAWVVSRDESSRSEEGSHALSALEEQFQLVRSDGLFRTRIFLYQRRPP
jgi:4-amino-4-deoxy-L-arabinose transferase-like glycosyltransferase